jgi:hybrid cluster-associated redox disulfide protein
MVKKAKITPKMTIRETMQKRPGSVFVFMDYGLHCISCPLAQDETLEEAVKVHRLDLGKLLKDLNKC